MQDEKQAALEARVAAVISEDNVSEAVTACSRYPQFEGRELSKFEDDCRDWGLIYGIAFGMAKAEQGDGPNGLVADRAYRVARKCFTDYAGEIEDPAVVRERAVRDLIKHYTTAQERAWKAGRYGKTAQMMTEDLRDALSEFEIVMGGQVS